MKETDIHKSSAINNLNTIVLKGAFLVLILQLTFMYNLSFVTNTFPELVEICSYGTITKTW